MPPKTVTQIRDELADREAIRDCLMRYCRGIDRADIELLNDVYWPNATDDHIMFKGTGAEFIAFVLESQKGLDLTMHKLGNIFIEINGSTACCESYFDAFHRKPGQGGKASDLVVGGRYLDRFEKRDDQWKIAERSLVFDWYRQYEDSGDWSASPLGVVIEPGGRKPVDRSYKLFT